MKKLVFKCQWDHLGQPIHRTVYVWCTERKTIVYPEVPISWLGRAMDEVNQLELFDETANQTTDHTVQSCC